MQMVATRRLIRLGSATACLLLTTPLLAQEQYPDHACSRIHTCASDIRSFDLCRCNYGRDISGCRRIARDCSVSIPGTKDRPRGRAGSDLRQHSNRIGVDSNSASDCGCSLPHNCPNHLRHSGRTKAQDGPRRHSDRASVLVGVPLSEVRGCHRKRTPYSSQFRLSTRGDLPQADVGRRQPQLLGPATGRQDRFDRESCEQHVDGSSEAGALSRPVCTVLRFTARVDVAARICRHSRAVCCVDQESTATGATRSCGGGRKKSFRDAGLHELSYGLWNGGNRKIRS